MIWHVDELDVQPEVEQDELLDESLDEEDQLDVQPEEPQDEECLEEVGARLVPLSVD